MDSNAVQSLSRLYECFAPRVDIEAQGEAAPAVMEKLFVFSLVWSSGKRRDPAYRDVIRL